jgi:hypothetical protein
VKVVVALLAAAAVAVPAAAAYRNPTPGRAVVLQIPGMHRAKVQRNVVYRSARVCGWTSTAVARRAGCSPLCSSAAARARRRRSAGRN